MPETDFLLVPITAIAFVGAPEHHENRSNDPSILAAEGHVLRLLDVDGNSLGCTSGFLRSQPIHGITVAGRGDALVWGNRMVSLIPQVRHHFARLGDTGRSSQVQTAEAPDWIFDAAFHPYDETTFALVTAHNELILGTRQVAKAAITLRTLDEDPIFPSRPSLYSAKLAWLTHHCLLVAAGTVFGEIVLWRCHFSAEGREGGYQAQVLHVLTGHEGSIFGVDISSEIEIGPDASIRLLASCSDDRTLRIWNISDSMSQANGTRSQAVLDVWEARETGFGLNIGITLQSNPLLPATVEVGHLSRIWNITFGSAGAIDSGIGISIFSFGEDATTRQWSLDIPAQYRETLGKSRDLSSFKLTHNHTHYSHNGKHIWSSALLKRGYGKDLVTTGGADGAISLIRGHDKEALGKPPSEFGNCSFYSTTMHQILESCQVKVRQPVFSSQKKMKKEASKSVFSRYAFLSPSKLMTLSPTGRLLLYSFLDERWRTIAQLPDGVEDAIGANSVLSTSRSGLAFVGASKGQIYWYHEPSSAFGRLDTLLSSKISGMWCLSDEDSSRMQLLVKVLGTHHARILFLRTDAGRPEIEYTRMLELDPRFIVTATAIRGRYLLLGSRTGFLGIFYLQETGNYNRLLEDQSVCSKTVDAITAILPLPGEPSGCLGSILTTTRDGKYRIFSSRPTLQGHPVSIIKIHETSPPFGPMIEGAWLQPKRQQQHLTAGETSKNHEPHDLILCGFKSKHFVVWNETKRRTIASVFCGGAHRSFAYTHLPASAEAIRFAFTKSSTMNVFSQARANSWTLKPGGHGRYIRAIDYKLLPGNTREALIATGSEDTNFRIWRCKVKPSGSCKDAAELQCLATMEAHTTGLQQLAFQGEEVLFTSGGNEEFFVWRLSRLESLSSLPPAVAVVREAELVGKSSHSDLRIVDFCVDEVGIHGGAGPAVLITMALSNSTIKSYIYAKGKFALVAKLKYTGACVMKVRHLRVVVISSPTGLAECLDGDNRNCVSAAPRKQTKKKTEEEEEEEEEEEVEEDEKEEGSPKISARLVLLSAATDGYISIWDVPLLPAPSGREHSEAAIKPMIAMPLHEGAVKSICVLYLCSSRASSESRNLQHRAYSGTEQSCRSLVCTGGDDNALGMALLSIYRHNPSAASPTCPDHEGKFSSTATSTTIAVRVEKRFVLRSAHAAAITGIVTPYPTQHSDDRELAEGDDDEGPWVQSQRQIKIITTSGDQRVKEWEVDEKELVQDDRAPRINLVESWATSVADAGALVWMPCRQDMTEVGARREGEEDRGPEEKRERLLGRDAGSRGKLIVAGVGMEAWSC